MPQLTTVTSEESGADGVPNNPAGRVLAFLHDFQNRTIRESNLTSLLALEGVLGDPHESARMYDHVTRLRIQAESVPDLMKPYARYPGYGSYAKNYDQILDATKRLCTPAEWLAREIFDGVDGMGWSALEFANDVLSQHSIEVPMTDDRCHEYLSLVRMLTDEITRDFLLAPEDRTRIVDLLRKVEEALIDVKINGTLPVQEAVTAAGAIVRLSLWERVKSRPWVRTSAQSWSGSSWHSKRPRIRSRSSSTSRTSLNG